ncbi:hypothetical protein GLAREA_11603 [Glarea lozoyensis ATCC 20868]|uniref:F-box domain-containing protein n=1 Tax=Glarea lozoyensis (strain ATCC 20868 / MF5171) TaxID=1116229 RepID=S3CEU8_GLAL2|nr:uncharacterized protein GLAREA_11603 [Glarea lozoyensis ATCC 20868]EPE25022.1 hypothetical protein GLAREA_11603 [Glarea lozoyensis ATCC 20868]
MRHTSLDDLPTEVLILIFEHVDNLKPVVLLSRNVNTLARPLHFRSILLTQRKLNLLTGPGLDTPALTKIYAYIKKIEVRSETPLIGVASFISKCSRLRDIMQVFLTYAMFYLTSLGRWGGYSPVVSSVMTPDVAELIATKSPRIRLHLKSYSSLPPNDFISGQAIPTANLESLVATGVYNPDSGPLRDLLINAQNLKDLTLYRFDHGISSSYFSFSPLRRLHLDSCLNLYSSTDFTKLWGRTNLEYLRINRMSPYEILVSMPDQAMIHLRHLEIWQDGLVNPELELAQQEEITSVLDNIIVHAPNLQVFSVPCLIKKIRCHKFVQNSNLRVLRLRDFSEFIDHSQYPIITSDALGTTSPPQIFSTPLHRMLLVKLSCRWLTEMDIGLDFRNAQASSYLDVIACFLCLRYVTLRTHTLSTIKHVSQIDNSLDQEAATNWMNYLASKRFRRDLLQAKFIIHRPRTPTIPAGPMADAFFSHVQPLLLGSHLGPQHILENATEFARGFLPVFEFTYSLEGMSSTISGIRERRKKHFARALLMRSKIRY